ncbi:hypothetical protein W97_02644 [Coniosporium apollinis CBS 100218]|uniref:Uncharacterized protein n=1 Tax=Coniosporium apollinis (strain CBS 100218) TaxID=1168221 RepID=R7YNE0_CONA1|nr:uncharacterized protein W97_02644 [Coniosporium apollinis CBS 100218]EON63417.1 hypothetical protein W97_02644 [Coniosporium apollinis CBS 100218]
MYPKLQAFTVELSRVTPSGDLLFAGHADSDSDSASDSDGHGDDTYGDDVIDTVTNAVPHEPEPDPTTLASHSPGGSANALGHNTSSAYDRAIAIGAHRVRLFRKRIVLELFDPFVAAFSRALYRMPALGHGHLLLGCSGEELSAGVEVLAVGAGANGIWDHPAEKAARNRMRVTMGWRNGWVVPAEVRELWDQWVGGGGTLRING